MSRSVPCSCPELGPPDGVSDPVGVFADPRVEARQPLPAAPDAGRHDADVNLPPLPVFDHEGTTTVTLRDRDCDEGISKMLRK